MSDHIVTIGKAFVTEHVASTLAQMQANGNEDLQIMIGNMNEIKRFLINLNGSNEEAAIILNHLSSLQHIEDTLDGLKTSQKVQDHD